MRQVISAPATVDVSAYAARLAGAAKPVADPSRALCERFGYQTLYEIPVALQKRLRLELIAAHAQSLAGDPNAVCDHSVFAWLADWMRWLWDATPTEGWGAVPAAGNPPVEGLEGLH